jgi:hypothetical protein
MPCAARPTFVPDGRAPPEAPLKLPPYLTAVERELAEAERRRGPTERREPRVGVFPKDRRRGFRIAKLRHR